MIDLRARHPSVQQVAQWFAYDHLAGEAREVSMACHDLAEEMIDELPDSAELTAGLRKLVEAKDCFVRCTLGAPKPAEGAKQWLPDRPAPGPEAFQPPGR